MKVYRTIHSQFTRSCVDLLPGLVLVMYQVLYWFVVSYQRTFLYDVYARTRYQVLY